MGVVVGGVGDQHILDLCLLVRMCSTDMIHFFTVENWEICSSFSNTWKLQRPSVASHCSCLSPDPLKMIKHAQNPRHARFIVVFFFFALWSKSWFNLNSFMSSCSGARLQTRPERDASAERSNPPPPAQVSWKCFKIGMREHKGCPNGSIPACDGSFCGLGKDERVKRGGIGAPRRRAGNASHRQRSKYHAFHRKARQLWRMSYLCGRGETSNRTAEAGQLGSASCVSREQQSTPKYVSYTNKGQPDSDLPFLH